MHPRMRNYKPNYVAEFGKMGIVGWYDLARDKGNKVFNLMNRSRDFTNLLLSPNMDTDSNSDGVVDDFYTYTGTGITSVFSLDSVQKIAITASTSAGGTFVSQEVSVTPSEVISFSCYCKVTGTIQGRMYVDYFNGSTFLSATSVQITTSSDYTLLSTLNSTVPATATLAKIRLIAFAPVIGNTGSAWFKTALLVKAATLNHTGNTNGIVSGATAHPCGRFFDGVDDYISVPNDEVLNFSNQCSFGAFVKYNVLNAAYLCVKANDSLTTVQYGLVYNSTTKTFDIILNGTGRTHTTTELSINKWYFVIGTWDGINVKMYHNGVQEGTIASYSTSLFSSPNIRIGKREGAGATLLNGIIGDVFFANKALSAAQVKQVGKMLAWKYPGLAIAG